MATSSDLPDRILADMKKSGYPLEIKTLKVLLENGWYIIPQYHYIDPTKGVSRSVDFRCVKGFGLDSQWFSSFSAHMVIECKKLEDKQWVLFTMEMSDKLDSDDKFEYLNFVKKPKFPSPNFDIYLKVISYLHYFDFQRFAVNHYIPFNKSDTLYEAINQVLKALNSDKEQSKKWIEEPIIETYPISLFFPVVVCDDNLFDYEIENDALSESNHIVYTTNEGGEGFQPTLIDIVKIPQFENFISQIDQEITNIA